MDTFGNKVLSGSVWVWDPLGIFIYVPTSLLDQVLVCLLAPGSIDTVLYIAVRVHILAKSGQILHSALCVGMGVTAFFAAVISARLGTKKTTQKEPRHGTSLLRFSVRPTVMAIVFLYQSSSIFEVCITGVTWIIASCLNAIWKKNGC